MGNGWTSTGEVIIGETPTFITLQNPKYPDLPNILGNGAVGEVRFMLHDEANVPLSGWMGSGLSEVKLRFYGPIKVCSPPCIAFAAKVEWRKNSGDPWVDVTNQSAFAFEPYDLVSGVFKTTLVVTPKVGGNFPVGEYQISKDPSLQCDYGTGPFPQVRQWGFYTFTVQ